MQPRDAAVIGPLRRLKLAVVAVALAVLGLSTSVSAHQTLPHLLLPATIPGTPTTVGYRPNHFMISRISITHAHWSVWNGARARATAVVHERFPGTRHRTLTTTVRLARPAVRCQVYGFTALFINGRLAADLQRTGQFCTWVT